MGDSRNVIFFSMHKNLERDEVEKEKYEKNYLSLKNRRRKSERELVLKNEKIEIIGW